MRKSGDGESSEAYAAEFGAVGRERRRGVSRRTSDHLTEQAQAILATLENMGDGLALLDAESRIVFASRKAEELLGDQSSGIFRTEGFFRFRDAQNGERMQTFLEVLANGHALSATELSLLIHRTPPRQALILSLFPVAIHTSRQPHGPCVMVTIRDLSASPTPKWQLFAHHFQLSTAEVRLCLALVDSLSVNEYSEKYFISSHRARAQLRSVFSKTGARRQAELVRLILAFTRA